MFQRRVRPAEEELRDMFMLLAFAAVWYGSLFRALINGRTNGANGAIFLAGGILPLYIAYIRGRAALICRRKRRTAISRGRCCRGIVRRVEAEKVPFRGRHGHIYYRKRYYLVIEKIEDGFAHGTEIKTGAYRVPVHLYMKSPEVKLYSDPSGWNWYVEGLQCGRFRQNAGVFPTDDVDGDTYVGDALFGILYVVILLFLFFRLL
ncbi:MAG: hypothetical protein HFH93_07630 [Lachnospiraceae bacterium]|nr:hypothetical protein [Lachnospiraceae bacterium]